MLIKCNKCGELKEPEEFHKDKSRKSGKHRWCKECHNEYSKNNNHKNGMNKRVPKPTRNELYDMYWVNGMSTYEIGKKIGVSNGTVSNWKDSYDIPRRGQSEAAKSGENHWRWKKDRTTLRKGNLYCYKFDEPLKEFIRWRDYYICQNCGADENGRAHCVHHIHYDKDDCYPDLITLCSVCHGKTNSKSNRDYWEAYYMRKLAYRRITTEIMNMENELNIWNYGI